MDQHSLYSNFVNTGRQENCGPTKQALLCWPQLLTAHCRLIGWWRFHMNSILPTHDQWHKSNLLHLRFCVMAPKCKSGQFFIGNKNFAGIASPRYKSISNSTERFQQTVGVLCAVHGLAEKFPWDFDYHWKAPLVESLVTLISSVILNFVSANWKH